jgi:hypothetical protein
MRKLLKRIIFASTIITFTLVFTNSSFAVSRAGYEGLAPVVKYINFLINIMRWGSASIGGIITTVMGWQMIMNTQTEASQIAKKGLKNVVWGMFFIFCGSFIVDFFVSKFFNIIGG